MTKVNYKKRVEKIAKLMNDCLSKIYKLRDKKIKLYQELKNKEIKNIK